MCQKNMQKVQVYVPIRRSVYRDELRYHPLLRLTPLKPIERHLAAHKSKPDRRRLHNSSLHLQQHPPHNRVNPLPRRTP